MSPRLESGMEKLWKGIALALLGFCVFQLQKIDRKIDLTYEMVVTQQTRIEVHEEQLKNFRADIQDIKGSMKYVMNNTHPQNESN